MRHIDVSSRKPPSRPDDWDDFDIPTWDDASPNTPTPGYRSSSTSRSQPRRQAPADPLYDDYETERPRTRQTGRPDPYGDRPPRLSSRVPTRTTRPSRQDPYRDPYSDPSSAYPADPYYPAEPEYDRPQQRGAAASHYDLYADPAIGAGWDEAAVYDEAPVRHRRGPAGTRAARPSVSVPRPAISDTTIAAVVGVAILGLLVMAGVVWYGMGDLAPIIPWHLNSAGDVDRWVSSGTLWRLPFGSFMALAIGVVLGAFLWQRDRFAARFVIVSMCIVQVLAWVAVIDQLW